MSSFFDVNTVLVETYHKTSILIYENTDARFLRIKHSTAKVVFLVRIKLATASRRQNRPVLNILQLVCLFARTIGYGF